MVQLYVRHTDNNYYLLDFEDTENINYKLTVRDLNDITKIYSPFTQSFTIKATDKNKLLLGFIGNEKIQRPNNSGEFDSIIYISGFLFQSGKLKFEETNYTYRDQKTIKANFASNLTGLSEKLGDSTIQELFQDEDGAFDPKVTIDWSVDFLRNRLISLKNDFLANGIPFKYGIPFISNNRVWTYGDNLAVVDNIKYKQNKANNDGNRIGLEEVRPAVNYMSIMNHLLLKIGDPVICPAFSRPEVRDMYVWCSSETLATSDAPPRPLNSGWGGIAFVRFDELEEISGVSLPGVPKWVMTPGSSNGIFKIKRNESVSDINDWGDGFDVKLRFDNLVSLEGPATKIKVLLRNSVTGSVVDVQEIENNEYVFNMLDSQLDQNGEIYLTAEILPMTLMTWSEVRFTLYQSYRRVRSGATGNRVNRAKYEFYSINYTSSSLLGGSSLNLISCLPKMKCKDFLSSFFKTFNISVVSTGLQDQSMYWLTPSDILETNKPYSKRIVDYTPYVDVETISKKAPSRYTQYAFMHKESKYYESVYGDGTRFGELKYPAIDPPKPVKFEVKTEYSIIKQSNTFVHPSNARTCLGFEKGIPTVIENGGNRYKPVYDEFTIFYLKYVGLPSAPLSVQYTDTENKPIFSVLEASFKNPNTKTLAFGAENTDLNSLYLNYYKTFIELLLLPNTYQTEFKLKLPPNEIFLNFSNLNQGESNIPTGFRPQNEIIIGELRYSLVDSAINLTNGDTKLTVLNL